MSASEYYLIFDHLPDGLLLFDSNCKLLFANKKAQNIFGTDEEQLIRKGVGEFFSFSPEDNFPVNLIHSGEKEQLLAIKNAEKEAPSWFKATARPIFDTDNRLSKIVLSLLKNRPLESEETFKQLIKNSFDTLVLLDANGIQHFVSDSCRKIHGYDPEELTNISVIEEMIHPDDQEIVMKAFRNVVENNGIGGVQYRHRHKNGGWITMEAFASNQIDNPHINAVVINVRDITERKMAEEKLKENESRLKELNATKDKFFSIIAHDLINPFHSIIGFSDLALEQINNQEYEGLGRYLTIIQNSSQMALDLLMNLLEWSRTQTGRVEFNPEIFELEPLVVSILNLLFPLAEQKLINIRLNVPKDLCITADKAMLGTVFRNLISNGIKFTNRKGEIDISILDELDCLVFSIADNGVGIKPSSLEKLFRIEESCSTIGTQNEKGSGLGLLLCKEFVEIHGGKIWVKSEVGKGSIFKFSIPKSLSGHIKF